MKVKGLGLKIAVTMTTCVVLGGQLVYFADNLPISAEVSNPERFEGISHLLLTNGQGKPLTLPLSDNPIAIVLNNFSTEEKIEAIKAIERLDNISENIDYTILEKDDFSLKEKIVIHNNADLSKLGKNDAFGLAEFTYDVNKAQINYPINIYIDKSCQNIYDSHGVSLLSYVIKHEMMHTLGFADLYTKEYFDKSIMYYSVANGMELNDYSNFDERNIKQLYDNNYVTVESPSKMLFTSYLSTKNVACLIKDEDGMEF